MIVPPNGAGERLDRFLASNSEDLTRSRIRKLIDEGFIKLNGKPASASAKVKEGDEIEIDLPEPEPSMVEPENIDLDVIHEDGDIIIVNKPTGMVVHPAAGHRTGTLVSALLGHCADLSGIGGVTRPGIVHRLDKETSGLIVAAKNDTAHLSLSAQLKDRTLKRTYLAVVKGSPKEDEGTIETGIGRHKTHRKKMAVLKEGGRDAKTSYKLLQNLDSASLLEIKLSTGRTHQIRVHMLHINRPVMGDSTYGRTEKRKLINRQALHAWKLELIHPVTGETMEFTAPLPGDMAELINKLGGDPSPYQ